MWQKLLSHHLSAHWGFWGFQGSIETVIAHEYNLNRESLVNSAVGSPMVALLKLLTNQAVALWRRRQVAVAVTSSSIGRPQRASGWWIRKGSVPRCGLPASQVVV